MFHVLQVRVRINQI